MPLLIVRDERVQILQFTADWQSGDRIIYLLHDPRPILLKLLSGASQSTRLTLEKLSEVIP